MSMQTLIGLKRLSIAKQRLMPQLTPAQRRDLMLAMLTHVTVVARAAELGPVALATSEPDGPALARSLGVAAISDGGLPWNEGLGHALQLVEEPPAAVLYLAGDLPLLTVADLQAFASSAPPRGVVVARARDRGTNALLVVPPAVLAPRFGHPRSSEAHQAASHDLGLECVVVDSPGLALDVDTIEDAWDAGVVPRLIETGPERARG
ncbi:MAG TPA: 2-phospho-L-lactate guanylyltransferase [Candidatus Dormibacteraeota bacterium]|nr:2-phospho-L-lactate guanylyltransferase [Candidatus Dormibacteraeota bacterium]